MCIPIIVTLAASTVPRMVGSVAFDPPLHEMFSKTEFAIRIEAALVPIQEDIASFALLPTPFIPIVMFL